MFDNLRRAVLPEELSAAVDQLLDIKINGPEKMEIAPIKLIDAFLREQVSDIEADLLARSYFIPDNWDMLNRFFVEEAARD